MGTPEQRLLRERRELEQALRGQEQAGLPLHAQPRAGRLAQTVEAIRAGTVILPRAWAGRLSIVEAIHE